MKLPTRLENAITKLYTAFHNDELNAYDCEKCAVGNIVGNSKWVEPTFKFIDQIGGYLKNIITSEDILNIENSGYSAIELRSVEKLFMFGKLNGKVYFNNYSEDSKKDKEFKGLCAVVEYLCGLDNVQNVMDYTKLFETENDKPKYELSV